MRKVFLRSTAHCDIISAVFIIPRFQVNIEQLKNSLINIYIPLVRSNNWMEGNFSRFILKLQGSTFQACILIEILARAR